MIQFFLKHPRATIEMLGYIPEFMNPTDPRPAQEQFEANYPYGKFEPADRRIKFVDKGYIYPGDPMRYLLAEAKLHGDIVRVYDGAWVTITKPDGVVLILRAD